MTDSVFGQLQFDYIWSKNENRIFGGKSVNTVLLIAGDESGEFEKGQYEAYQFLEEKWEELQGEILNSILEYYRKRREELGFGTGMNSLFPNITDTCQLLEHITLVGIKIQYAEVYGGRSIGMMFDCTWDAENGVGVRLCDEKVIKVGLQDVAI